MRVLARRSVTALRDIAAGELLSVENVGLRRPGNGLPPEAITSVIGRVARGAIRKNALLARSDFN